MVTTQSRQVIFSRGPTPRICIVIFSSGQNSGPLEGNPPHSSSDAQPYSPWNGIRPTWPPMSLGRGVRPRNLIKDYEAIMMCL